MKNFQKLPYDSRLLLFQSQCPQNPNMYCEKSKFYEIWGSHDGEHEIIIFWDEASCNMVEVYQGFGVKSVTFYQTR
jgi:hypothetical protein